MYQQYANKGLTGLANIGNTCYINSCMQLLSHTYELNDLLNKNKTKLNNNIESNVYQEWNNLREMMWSENCTVAPYGFIKCIQMISQKKDLDIFSNFSQQDVSEFLVFIINSLHDSIKRPVNMTITGIVQNSKDILAKKSYEMMQQMYTKEYSEIINIFYGITVTRIISLKDNELLSAKCEPFSTLSLEIPSLKGCNIEDCIDAYCKVELMCDENAWYNEKTNQKENINKDIKFWTLPNILIITLKRFKNNNTKIQTFVNCPLINLNLSKYIVGYLPDSYIYDLFGTANHSGNVFGGHYTACIKNANDNWYSFNDTLINKISENDIITPHTYCLFYRKKNKA